MKKFIVIFLYLIISAISFSERVGIDIKTEIAGNLYIDDREVKSLEIGEVFKGRYLTGNYVLTLKNSQGIYQKNIILGLGENKFVFTEKDLLKSLIPKKEVKKEIKKIEAPKTQYIAAEKIKISPEKTEEKNIQEIPTVNEIEITEKNFESFFIKNVKNGSAYASKIEMEKYNIEEDPETANYIYLVSQERKEKTKEYSWYYLQRMESGRYPDSYGILKVKIELNLKDNYFEELVKFFKKFPSTVKKDVTLMESENINRESTYVYIVDSKRLKNNSLFDEVIVFNRIESRAIKNYISPLKEIKNYNLKLNLLDKNGKIVRAGSLGELRAMEENSYTTYDREGYFNFNEIDIRRNPAMRREYIIVLPVEQLNEISSVKIRSIYE